MLKTLSGRGNSFLLSFISGFADALFFIHLGGLFVGLVTGNAVLIGMGLVGHERGGLSGLQVMTFPAFMLGAGISAAMVARIASLERATYWALLVSAAGFASSAAMWALQWGPTALYVLPTVIAMGMLTAIDRLDPRLGPPFSLMTGNVAGLAVAATRRVIGYQERPEERGQSKTSIILVCGFVAGCAAGALAEISVGILGMFLPALLLCLIGARYAPTAAKAPGR